MKLVRNQPLPGPSNQAPSMDHDEAAILLPFYSNGSLYGAELKALEIHVKNCVACRRELINERTSLNAFKGVDPAAAMAQVALGRLMKQIDTAPVVAPRPRSALRQSPYLPRLWSLRSRRFVAAAGVALILCVVTLGGRTLQESTVDSPSAYRTLAAKEAARSVNLRQIHVVFREGISPETVQSVFSALELDLVRGPNAIGAYTVRPRSTLPAKFTETLAALRLQPNVRLAQGSGFRGMHE